MFQDEPWQPWQGWCPRTVHSVFACIFQNYKIYWHFQTSIVPKCRQQRFQPQETLLHLPHPAGRADNKYIERHHQNQTQQDPETTGNHIRVHTTTSWCLFSGRMCYSVVVTKRLFGGTFHFFEAIVGNTLQCCILLFHAVSVSLPVDIHWIVSFQTASSSSSNSSPSFEYMHQCCIKQKFRWSRVGHRAVTVCIHLGVKKIWNIMKLQDLDGAFEFSVMDAVLVVLQKHIHGALQGLSSAWTMDNRQLLSWKRSASPQLYFARWG